LTAENTALDVVCLSLEPWDDVWRRNQWLASEVLKLDPSLRLLFAELPVDPAWAIVHRQVPKRPRTRTEGATGRLWVTTPWKPLPRRIWSGVDNFLEQRIVASARRLGMSRPVLWINDSTYAGLVAKTGWPSVYDITDDWLDLAVPPMQAAREHHNDDLLVRTADEIVVCSPALRQRRGTSRQVHLIPNGVDADHLRRPQTRPADLPAGRTVVYQGTLAESRLDIDLCVEICRAIRGTAHLVFVGPNSLSSSSERRLREEGALLLGAKPYDRLPGYLQHADVLVVPHDVTPFTESLDPIKAREFIALGRPTLSTPVAGFRDLGPPIVVAAREDFPRALLELLAAPLPPGPGPVVTAPTSWAERAVEFLAILRMAAAQQ
jgi:teichuronic acid biosynthesis glycosyltransferase TuaH